MNGKAIAAIAAVIIALLAFFLINNGILSWG